MNDLQHELPVAPARTGLRPSAPMSVGRVPSNVGRTLNDRVGKADYRGEELAETGGQIFAVGAEAGAVGPVGTGRVSASWPMAVLSGRRLMRRWAAVVRSASRVERKSGE